MYEMPNSQHPTSRSSRGDSHSDVFGNLDRFVEWLKERGIRHKITPWNVHHHPAAVPQFPFPVGSTAIHRIDIDRFYIYESELGRLLGVIVIKTRLTPELLLADGGAQFLSNVAGD